MKNNNVFEKILNHKILNYCDYPLTILAIYASTFFIYQDFEVRIILGYAILSFLLLPIIAKNFLVERKIKITIFHWIYILLIGFIFVNYLRPSSYHDKESFAYIIIMLISTGYLLFSKISSKDIKFALSVFAFTAIAFSVLIIFFQIFKSSFWVTIFPLLSETAQELATKYFFRGYSVSFGGVAYTSYILIFGFYSILGRIMYFDDNKKTRNYLFVSLGLIFLTVFLLGRRGELASFLLSLIILYIFLAKDGMRLKRAIKVSLVMIAIFALIVILLPFLTKVKFLHRYTMTLNSMIYGTHVAGGVTSGRTELYKEAWSLFIDNKLFGVGWGSFSKYGYLVLGKPQGTIRNVHNIFLQLLAETGLVGLICVISPMLYLYYQTYLVMKKNSLANLKSKNNYIQLAANVSLICQTFILIVCLIDPINYKNIFWILYSICILLSIYAYLNSNIQNQTFPEENGIYEQD